MSELDEHTGGCFCGAVRYVARGEPLNVRVCHCDNCRRITGSAFFARALFPAEAVEISGETEATMTSEHLARRFCPKCGSHVFGERPDGRAVTLGTLDAPERLPPQEHVFVSRKLPWLKLDDGLPQHAEWAPA